MKGICELNSSLENKQDKGLYVKCKGTEWGVTATLTASGLQFIVLVDTLIYVVWFASTTTVNVRNIGANTTATGTNSCTLDTITFARNGRTLTVNKPTFSPIMIYAY